ncbi:response regulator [Pigmentiphaga aceris]|uniref:Virulence sensor protein BvgS n=1 Tax=Pigmentiphaga aceris TaxID=1940612 RepID=A0A5C0B6N3_9BURK|nr:response regulator [Pigmentiphaga aceris]QEI08297.1 response regulator [Pigmentiphaga aceris]
MPTPKFSSRLLPLIIIASYALIFLIDVITPAGYAPWVLYFVPVALTLFGTQRYLPFLVAAVSTGLLLGSIYAKPDGVALQLIVWNRLTGVVVVWAIATLAHLYVKSRVTLQRQSWVQQAQVLIAQQAANEQSPEQVADKMLRAITDYLGAKVGVVYALEGQELQRLATWAVPDASAVPATLKVGEGLTGQAIIEQRVLHASSIGPGYLKVGSALGETLPVTVVAAPLTGDGGVVGVIELGFVGDPVLEDIVAVMNALAQKAGMALRAARYRSRLHGLLEESQRQSEELQVQQEELRVSNEELEERGRALMASQARLETQQAELEQTNVQLEEHTQSLERQKQHLVAAQRTLAENAQTLERANQYKSEFLANMSHELRTPLNSSLILAKLLADNRDGNLTADQVRYANTIHSSNTDLLVLINDILDLAKVEAGHIETVIEPVALDAVLQSLDRSFQPVANERNLRLVLQRQAGTPASIATDNQRLMQILRNLLSNAFKFTEKGEVALRIAPAHDGFIRFEVSDTGIGIAPSQRDIIFEAFQQADGTISRQYGGSGLGLSISREFAQLLGGSIELSSELGAGSTFALVLPLTLAPISTDRHTLTSAPEHPPVRELRSYAPPAAAPAPAPAAPVTDTVGAPSFPDDRAQRTRGQRLILTIEDDAAFSQILYDLAHELDFDCVRAATAQEGISLARQLQPSGVLLDMGLPDNSGLLVLEQLKRDPATRHIPIHVISVNDHVSTARLLGAVGYTFKPADRENLVSVIQALQERTQKDVRRILVVEDDLLLRENIKLLLEPVSGDIEGVGTVADALTALSARSFDCMVMDLALPDGSGYDLLEKMAGNIDYAFPPVIVYTGRNLSADEEQRLRRYSKSIIIKGARSPERLLDEVTLFLHSVEAELPAEQQRMLREARQRDQAFEGRRILLAEDDIRNIFALSQVIEPLGAHLEIARNGREALDLLQRHPDLDLVLMDIMMPEMDGITAMQEIRQTLKMTKLPIIALTAKAMPADRERCLEAGANDYISKPIDVDKLLSLCRVWLPH